jgi:hypothetical protein
MGVDADHDELVARTVAVNGVEEYGPELLSHSCEPAGTCYPNVEYTVLRFDMKSGHNLIDFNLTPQAYTNGCGGQFWYIWDVRLEYWTDWLDEPIQVDLAPRFQTETNATLYSYNPDCGGELFDEYEDISPKDDVDISNDQCRCVHDDMPCHPSLPDSVIEGRMARRLISAPNDSFLIQDVIDGIVCYVTDTELHGATDALDPSEYYRRLLRVTNSALGTTESGTDRLLISMHTAFPSATNLADSEVLVHRLRVAATAADAAGVYRFPLAMYFMDPADRRGIFDRPGDETTLLLQWPTNQELLPGWYQQYVHVPPGGTDVDMVVDVWDGRDVTDGDKGCLVKSVSGGGLGAYYYAMDPFADGAFVVERIPADGSLLTSTTADPVILGLSSTGGVSIYLRVTFDAFDELDKVIPITEWNFQSGVSDLHTIEIYDELTQFFERVRSP